MKDWIERYFREEGKTESDDTFGMLRSRTLKMLQQEGLTTAAMRCEEEYFLLSARDDDWPGRTSRRLVLVDHGKPNGLVLQS